MPPVYARPESLASPDWLAENITRGALRVLDCRYRVDGRGRELYLQGHIPGAVYLDWANELVAAPGAPPAQIAGPAEFAAAMRRAGLGDGTVAVLYDDVGSLYASHVWCVLDWYGCDAVRILDGGWSAWQESGRPVSTAQPAVEPTVFTPRTQPSCRLATQDVQALLGSPDVALIDARPPAEYTGVEGMSPRPGHLPGALNIPAVLVTDSDGCFRPAAELSRLVARAGLKSPRRIVIYDGAGIGAAKVAFALSLIGYTNIAVYGPGWTEWSARPDLPVET